VAKLVILNLRRAENCLISKVIFSEFSLKIALKFRRDAEKNFSYLQSVRCRIYDFFKMTLGKTPKAENSRKRESASCRIKKIVENSNRRGAEVPLFQKTAFGKMPKAPQIVFLFLLHILKNGF